MNAKRIRFHLSGRYFLSILVVMILITLISIPVGATSQTTLVGRWDRLNFGPEHETFSCGQGETWHCRYDKQPEPTLGYITPDATYGLFTGQDVTSTWDCPEWTADICNNMTFVVEGWIDYYVWDGSIFSTDGAFVLAEINGDQVMYFYWLGLPGQTFACPWYRSFDAALAANPELENDCIYPP